MTTAPKKKSPSSSGKRVVSSSNVGLWLIGASVAIVAVVVGLIVFNEQRTRSAPVSQPDVPAEWISRTSLGSPDAKVVVQAWEDFMCPSCQTWSQTVKPQLIEEYVKTGKVRLEFHHFPLGQHEPGASMSALAAECAADQGAFWPYHDKVFKMAALDQQQAVQFDDLVGYASELGLDNNQFTACLSSQQHRDTINASVGQATEMKLSFTPSILVNDTLLQDASYPALKMTIEGQLAALGQ